MTTSLKTTPCKISGVPATAEHKRFLHILLQVGILLLVTSVVGISTASRNPSGTQPNTIRSMSRADQVGKRVCLPEDSSTSQPAMMPGPRPVQGAEYAGEFVIAEVAPLASRPALLSFLLRSPPESRPIDR